MDINIIVEFLGWCSIVNIGMLFFMFLIIVLFKKSLFLIHGKMFNLDDDFLSKIYFKYLAQYKIITIIFNIVPYFVLKSMI